MRSQEVAEAERFAGGQKGEQRSFVLGQTTAEQGPEQGCRHRMERPAGVQVPGQLRLVPAGSLGNPCGRGRDGARPVLDHGSLTGPANRRRGETDDLIATFAKREITEAALDLRPLVPVGRPQLVGVLIERLVQDGQYHERGFAAARGDFRERLQQVNVAPGRLLRRVLQRLAGLVDNQQQAGAGLRGDSLNRFLETIDDVGGRAAGHGRGRSVQVPLDGLQDPRLRALLPLPDGFERRAQGPQQERVQRRTLRREDSRMQRPARKGECRSMRSGVPAPPPRSGTRSATADRPGRRRTRSFPTHRVPQGSTPGHLPRR